MSIELKIKSKSLAAEASIIRLEERRLKARALADRMKQKEESAFLFDLKRDSLSTHRRGIVRKEARATFLARAFQEGKPLVEVEEKNKGSAAVELYNLAPKIAVMVNRYSAKKVETKDILDWVNERKGF